MNERASTGSGSKSCLANPVSRTAARIPTPVTLFQIGSSMAFGRCQKLSGTANSSTSETKSGGKNTGGLLSCMIGK
jgi:hypothetical protein